MTKIFKLGSVAVGTLVTLVSMALPALAQQQYPPQPPAETQTVQAPAEVAFTGSDVTLLVVMVGVLLIAGVSALILARRRAGAVG